MYCIWAIAASTSFNFITNNKFIVIGGLTLCNNKIEYSDTFILGTLSNQHGQPHITALEYSGLKVSSHSTYILDNTVYSIGGYSAPSEKQSRPVSSSYIYKLDIDSPEAGFTEETLPFVCGSNFTNLNGDIFELDSRSIWNIN